MDVVEARLVWGDEILAVARARGRVLRVSDFALPGAFGSDVVVARADVIVTPVLAFGAATLFVACVEDEPRLPRAKGDHRVAKGVALAAVLHGTILAMAILGRAPIGDDEAGSLALMQGYLAAIEARSPATPVDQQPSLGDSASRREEGASGDPARQTKGGITRKTLGLGVRRTEPSEDRPESFGMIALLGGARAGGGTSPFAALDGPAAMGSLFGATIDDAPGSGGLGLGGIGEGGGGSGAGVPVVLGDAGGSGTCDAACVGSQRGFGRGSAFRLGGSHVVRAPVFRCGVKLNVDGTTTGCDVTINGRLPPEAVQRVVRQSFGRLRACYESGLRRDPGLEGRIAVKFIIDREGAVTMASVTDRSLPDSDVAACVARAYEAMTFPKPEGGIVTVVYPVVFGS